MNLFHETTRCVKFIAWQPELLLLIINPYQGETGVARVITKFIHRSSKRKDGPFIKIDCSSIPENLLESELFGYEKVRLLGNKLG